MLCKSTFARKYSHIQNDHSQNDLLKMEEKFAKVCLLILLPEGYLTPSIISVMG